MVYAHIRCNDCKEICPPHKEIGKVCPKCGCEYVFFDKSPEVGNSPYSYHDDAKEVLRCPITYPAQTVNGAAV